MNRSAQILAPLAILPDAQNKGVGGKLIQEGLRQLQESGVELVFVLGHPDHYPRYGFNPAGTLGYEAPYHIPEKHAGAWMVQELHNGVIGRVTGKIQCSEVLNQNRNIGGNNKARQGTGRKSMPTSRPVLLTIDGSESCAYIKPFLAAQTEA